LNQRSIILLGEETLGSFEIRHLFQELVVDLDGPGAIGLLISLADLNRAAQKVVDEEVITLTDPKLKGHGAGIP
jgi:hypothetical protein